MKKEEKKLIANNKKAYHDYFIEQTYEAGIALAGTEVKSLRLGQCSIKEAYVGVHDGEMYIYHMHINPYEKEISSTRIPSGPGSSFSIRQRSGSWQGQPPRTDIPSCPFPFISGTEGPRWRSVWQRVRSCTTSGTPLQRRTRNGKQNGNSRYGI